RVLRPPRSVWRRTAMPTLAVAAALALLMVVTNRRPGPVPLGGGGPGTVTVDGQTVPANRPEALARLLHPGARVTLSDDAELDLHYPGVMVWRLEPGTTAVLPPAPGRWYGKALECRLEKGELGLRTGPGFPGARLAIVTAEGRAIVTGTLVSVYRDDAVTCVCVVEGAVVMETASGEVLGNIEAGRRRVLFRDGSEPLHDAIAPPHQAHLQAFDGACGNVFGP
ncbi:FecR family protein, partial [bacterium]|nr:FecR family protein [bacterium]